MKILEDKLQAIESLKLKRLSRWAVGESAPPIEIVLQVTNRCDLKCVFCMGAFSPKDAIFYKDELEVHEWVRIVEEATQFGVMKWTITGGEPLMRAKCVIAIVRTIKKLNSRSMVELVTNGSFLTAEVARQLVRWQCDLIQLGIDGPTAQIHDFLRGTGSFERVTQAARHLTAAKERLGKPRPVLMVNTVLNAKNYDRLADMVRLAHSLGADILVVTAMRLYEENLSWIDRAGLRLNNRQKRRLLTIWKEVEKVARSCGLEVKQAFREGGEEVSEAVVCERPRVNERERPEVVNPFLSAFCFAPFYSLTIYGTGAVGLCHTFPAKPPKCPKCGHQNLDSRSPFCEECGLTLEIVYGLRTQKLKKVWYGEYSQFVRKCLGEGKPFENACEVCGRRTDIRKIVAQLADHLNQCDGVKGWKIK